MREKGCTASTVGYYLVIAGAINWGLVGIGYFFHMNWNLVEIVLGNWAMLESLVYIVIGVAGVMTLMGCKCATCAACKSDAANPKQ